MTTHRPKTLVRALAAILTLGVMLAPTMVTEASAAKKSAKKSAKPNDPKFRKVSPPNVFYPLTGTKAVKDQRSFSKRNPATDIKAPCGATVRASHAGVAAVFTNPKWGRKVIVRVVGGRNGLFSQYGFLTRSAVTAGQLIQSGQALGTLGAKPSAKTCALQFKVSGSGRYVDPTKWLNTFVGNTPPLSAMFNTRAINLASFNVLGASHTRASTRYATYSSRMAKTVNLFNARNLQVVGLQEFQDPQKAQFLKLTGDTFGMFHIDTDGDGPKPGDTDNAIIWRKSAMELVSSETIGVPYFKGNERRMPVVLLREKATGRTAYFINVHNPANTQGPAQRWRNRAVVIEKNKMTELRQTGRPVFLMGDFNDREEAFCPLTAKKLSISPNSIPSNACALPRQFSIDWIFAAGQTRFSYYLRDTSTQQARISDHPIVITRAHLQN